MTMIEIKSKNELLEWSVGKGWLIKKRRKKNWLRKKQPRDKFLKLRSALKENRTGNRVIFGENLPLSSSSQVILPKHHYSHHVVLCNMLDSNKRYFYSNWCDELNFLSSFSISLSLSLSTSTTMP